MKVGGENDESPNMKIDFGDLEIRVELKQEITEDDLKGGDSKARRGSYKASISKKS